MHLIVRIQQRYQLMRRHFVKHSRVVLELNKIVEVSGAFRLGREVAQDCDKALW